MRILHPWLGDYLRGALPAPAEIAERLTFAGLEVESVEEYGAGARDVLVARVESVEPHPAADNLSVCRVFDGTASHTVVCGAPNVRAGMLAPFAGPGTRLPGGVEIGERELRGVASSGMLLSAAEIGLWEDHSGLLDLGDELEPGTGLRDLSAHLGAVFDVSATPNRPDALSHVGIAREVAALFGLELALPQAAPPAVDRPVSEHATVQVEAAELCGRYVALVVEGVTVAPSPLWLRARLAAAGIRPINNVVDVTNYVLLELGHPLHAFDLDMVEGSTVIVRRAGRDEKLTTLDGVQRSLTEEDLVIADASAPLALAGVMGGERSEVTTRTRRLLIESAWFEPTGIRRASRRHGLHTESSHRFERGADPLIPPVAALRAAALITELSGGELLSGVIDVNPMPHEPRPVRLRFSRTDRVLGLPIPQGEQERILISLGFEVIERAPESLLLGPPSFRTEMGREIDVIEEVARIHGYHHLPATLPGREPEIGPEDEARGLASLVTRLRAAAAAAGCHEVVNYSFLSARDNAALTIAGGSELREAQHLTISNPLSAEQAVMRNSLLVSLLGNLRHNLRFRRSDLKLYEVGRAYLLGDEGVIDEPNRFGAVLMGARSPLSWTGSTEQVDFFDVKGLVESTLQRLGIRDEDVVFEAAADAIPWLHPRSACSMHTRSRGETLGWLGEVHPKVADAFDVPRGVVCVELHIDTLRGLARLVPEHEAVPRFPAVLRDLAVVVDDDVSAGTIQELIEASLGEAEALGARVSGVTLFDVYTGPQVGEGKRSLAFAVRYEASDRTLTDAEAARVHDAIVARLQSEVGATLRA